MEVSGRGVGARWCLGEGAGGARGRRSWAQRPLPAAAPRPGLLFCSPLCPDPRTSSGSGSRPPHHPARA